MKTKTTVRAMLLFIALMLVCLVSFSRPGFAGNKFIPPGAHASATQPVKVTQGWGCLFCGSCNEWGNLFCWRCFSDQNDAAAFLCDDPCPQQGCGCQGYRPDDDGR